MAKKKKNDIFEVECTFQIRKEFITNFMKFKNWSVNDLTEKMGYKKQQVSQTLNGTIEPTMNFLHRLCSVTGVSASEILETVFVK